MNIGFDAKRIFHNTTGLGNYGRDLVKVINKWSVLVFVNLSLRGNRAGCQEINNLILVKFWLAGTLPLT